MIDLSRFQELEDFIFDQKSKDALKQIKKCDNCFQEKLKENDCKIKDFCDKYTPIEEETNDDQNVTLIKDLFSTIKFLLNFNKELAELFQKKKS